MKSPEKIKLAKNQDDGLIVHLGSTDLTDFDKSLIMQIIDVMALLSKP